MRELLFHFDYVSPYSYLAWTQIHALAERRDARVRPVPTLFAALLGAHGTVGPGEVPARRVYVFKDAFRKAHALGLPPLRPPPSHPFNPLLALRASGLPMDEGARRLLIDALWAATWATGRGCESREAVGEALRAAGLDPEARLAEAEGPAAKARLRADTDEAIAASVFGVPTVRAEGELFWGTDSLPHLEAFLRGEDPLPPALASSFGEIPASATRRR
jgi:2-hydroxychromene-2-carboxylate isomerase